MYSDGLVFNHTTIGNLKKLIFSSVPLGPHFVAVNNKNEIVVTDFHNHSVKVGVTSKNIDYKSIF